MTAGLVFRQDYFSDPGAYAGLADLLQATFGIDIRHQDRLGGPNPTSMPFAFFDADGRCVANFSTFAMPLIINGRKINAAGYQSGAVRPEFRGKGLYADLMRRAFSWVRDQNFQADVLLTDKPALYRPYGFRSLAQHMFCGTVSPSTQQRDGQTLSIGNARDIALLQRLLNESQPVSATFSAARRDYFLLNACFDTDVSLTYLPRSDYVVAWKRQGQECRLLDVVGATIPPLADIIAGLGINSQQVTVCFPPDKLEWTEYLPVAYGGDCVLMIAIASDIALPNEPLMLSPMADF